MAQILDMPQLSDTMKIGVLQKWRKNEGDSVAPGEILAEVETDKAVMDFEAFDQGVLLKRLIADGTSVPVGTPIAIIGKAGDDIAKLVEEAKARAAGGAAKPAAPRPRRPSPPGCRARARARRQAGCRRSRPCRRANGQAARPALPPRPAPRRRARRRRKVLASPLARKLATDLGVDLRTVQGSGPGGRIVERDVKAVAGERQPRPRRRLARRRGSARHRARDRDRAARVGRGAAARAAGPRAPRRGPPGRPAAGRRHRQAAVDDAADDRRAACSRRRRPSRTST